MAEKKRFLLRLDPGLHAALERWAADDLRSINGQIELILKEAARLAARDEPADPYRASPPDDDDDA